MFTGYIVLEFPSNVKLHFNLTLLDLGFGKAKVKSMYLFKKGIVVEHWLHTMVYDLAKKVL